MIPHGFHFASPLFFLFYLVLGLFLVKQSSLKTGALPFSSLTLFDSLDKTLRQRFSFIPNMLFIFSFILAVMALARPQITNQLTENFTQGIDIVLALDTSGSMKGLDFELDGNEATRLDVVKKVVADFVDKRPYDRLGMVVFGDYAYTQSPLTTDGATLKSYLSRIEIGIAGDGTAIGNAIATGVKRLKDQKTKSKIIILLTDGKSNAGEITPDMASQIAHDLGIKIYTIGVGTMGPVPYYEDSLFGKRKAYAEMDYDEEALQNIAKATGGLSFHAKNTQELENIYTEIDKLEKTEIKIKQYQESKELYAYCLIPALFLFVAALLLSRTYFMRVTA
ncbi:VWA domain-containing protein [bacterium]|nr:VWA domain-containing protein [bacterium]